MTLSKHVATCVLVIGVAATAATAAYGMHFSSWGQASLVAGVNTTFADGCPIESPDGLRLYMASNRPGGQGGLDIWVARRDSGDAAWGTPENLGAAINSSVDDFCPTPVPGHGLFFVSRREPASCGTSDSDIYFSRLSPMHGWSEPRHLGCAPGGPNTSSDEQGPSYFEAGGRAYLYYSSGPDIFASEVQADGTFGPGQAVDELNSSAVDIQPNVRKDGLEIVFASNRAPAGTQDVYTASRSDAGDPWSAPTRLGENVNTVDKGETRPSFSRDGSWLYFGRNPGPVGSNDIFVATREKVSGGGD